MPIQAAKAGPSKTALNSAPLSADWRRLAEDRCKRQGERLTVARLAAYAELLASKNALSAYDLIARLEKRQSRKIAPLTVYRHLEFLTRVGLVHRIETNQSYLPCDHPQHTHESQYLLCTDCGNVEEVHSKTLENTLEKIAAKHGFRPVKAVVELKGICSDCT